MPVRQARTLVRRRIAHAAALLTASACLACARDTRIRTLEAGTIAVAVTTGAPSSEHDPQLWIRRYIERFAREERLAIRWIVVPFDRSWLRASRDEVDLVATNVASFPDRAHGGGTFSAPFLYERRALRIHAGDRDGYAHIDDFADRRVGVVRGTAAERDVRRRAPARVRVVAVATFAELYEQFASGRLDAVAEAEYYALDGHVIPSHGPDVVLVDLHDLTPGEREESVFVVRDRSTNLLARLNAFIARTPFPP
jgi:ABC-type amino acid transport substrate-binding protein